MMSRCLAALIVLFWLVSTGWLVRSIQSRSVERGEPVELEEALGAFFRWNDTTSLTILENGVKIGQMSLSGIEGADARRGGITRGFSSTGTLDEPAMENRNRPG